MTRTTPSGGFRIDASGGANAFVLDSIIFSDAVDEISNMSEVVPLVESTPDALGSGSIVRVDDCEFRNFVNGTFFIGSFSSDDASGSTFDVRSSVFVNNTGVDPSLSFTSECCGGAIDIEASSSSTISIVASEFSSNNATGDGGAVRISSDGQHGPSSVSIESTLFRMNNASNVGALFVDGPGGVVDVQNSIFTGNAATENAGAVLIENADAVDIQNSNFISNTASIAGAVLTINVDTVDIRDSSYTNNRARSNAGGALFALTAGNVLVSGSSFTNNTAVSAGAFRAQADNVVVQNTSFSNNAAVIAEGGALTVEAALFLEIRDAVFSNNTASTVGGAIGAGLLDDGNVTIQNSVFTDNTAAGSTGGGAVVAFGGSGVDIRDSMFINNTAQIAGAFRAQVDTVVRVQNTSFSGNNAFSGDSGALLVEAALFLEIRDAVFSNNTASTIGGAIGAGLLDDGNVTIQNSIFTDNTAAGSSGGGAVGILGGSGVDIRDSTFTNNTAQAAGGAVLALFLSRFTCVRASFIDNIAGSAGGGVFTSDVGPVNFTANEFVRNEAGTVGGGFSSDDTSGTNPLFTNISNVFIDNTAPSFPNSRATGFTNTS